MIHTLFDIELAHLNSGSFILCMITCSCCFGLHTLTLSLLKFRAVVCYVSVNVVPWYSGWTGLSDGTVIVKKNGQIKSMCGPIDVGAITHSRYCCTHRNPRPKDLREKPTKKRGSLRRGVVFVRGSFILLKWKNEELGGLDKETQGMLALLWLTFPSWVPLSIWMLWRKEECATKKHRKRRRRKEKPTDSKIFFFKFLVRRLDYIAW